MKKIIFLLITVMMSATSLYSKSNDAFGSGRYTRLAYSWSQTAIENGSIYDGKYAFALVKGTTYRVHKNPIAKILKFGIDATWTDIQFAKYKDPSLTGTWTSEIDNTLVTGDSSSESNFNIGYMALSYSLGVGPSVCVAPFLLLNNKLLSPLHANLYFHYCPTVTAYMASQDGDVEFSGAYCNMFNFGGNIVYKCIGIGIEGKWGSGKFKPIEFVSDGLGSDKYKRKFANTRLYVQFTF